MSRLVVVSNRIASPDDKGSAGGLAVGVLGALKAAGGLWFGWSGDTGNEDKPLKKVTRGNITWASFNLSEQDYEEYYCQFSNAVLWPAFHYRLDLVQFQRSAWEGYQRVNALLVDKLLPLLGDDDIIWVHDYHLLPFACELRKRGVRNRIGFFLHIPFPTPEIFNALPPHLALLEQMCDFDLLGFQTENDRQAFLDCLAAQTRVSTHKDKQHLAWGKAFRTQVYPIGMEPDEMQILAVKEAVKNGLLVITGGPGTGKTTTINTIIRYFESEGMDIALAAPTGRAAKRMSDTTGYEARTIHRMLELNGGMDGNAGFSRNADHPLETDVIIIDEMSMVDINLMYALLKAVTAGTRLILVGDVNQLPSVGPGSVLKDIIDSEAFPVVKLTKIFRQATQSDIIINAHKINDGEEVVLDNKSMDFFFLKRYEADKIINVTIQLIAQKLPKFVDASPFDIQVLTPMRKGLLGVERLNGILQQYLNPKSEDKKEREHGSHIFREGDKVMQTKNNYQLEWEIRSKYGFAIDKGLGVFNGDMGIIKEINEYAETMTVEFDEGRMVDYSLKNLDELELAYAITIHKSQGSEYPAVVIPLLNGPQMLMNRNLLYTAVTRAKKCVTLVGDENTFVSMIQNTRQQKRYTGLGEEIRKLVSA